MVESMHTPVSIRDIRVLLSFTLSSQSFICLYTRVMAPISKLQLNLIGRWEWTWMAQDGFGILKNTFAEALSDQHSNLADPNILQTDAMGREIACIRKQSYTVGICIQLNALLRFVLQCDRTVMTIIGLSERLGRPCNNGDTMSTELIPCFTYSMTSRILSISKSPDCYLRAMQGGLWCLCYMASLATLWRKYWPSRETIKMAGFQEKLWKVFCTTLANSGSTHHWVIQWYPASNYGSPAYRSASNWSEEWHLLPCSFWPGGQDGTVHTDMNLQWKVIVGDLTNKESIFRSRCTQQPSDKSLPR